MLSRKAHSPFSVRPALSRIASLVAMALALAACAATPVEDPNANQLGRPALVSGDMAQYVVNGVTESGYPAVGMLPGCTGTLIGPSTVLTAGHCVDGYVDFAIGGTTYDVADIVRHESYGGGNYNDVALLILQRPVTGIAPFAIARSPITVGADITIVGFGRIGEYQDGFGTKRSATNQVGQVDRQTFDFYGSSGGTGNVCNGDSGGPSFAMIDGQEVQVGIHSTKHGTCGEGGTDMRVDYFVDWIVRNARGDVPATGTPPPPAEPPPGGGTMPPPGGGTAPPPTPGPDPGTPGTGSLEREGLACTTDADCVSTALGCVAVHGNGGSGSLLGAYCLERCRSAGAPDSICDGGEACLQSREAGPVCFDAYGQERGFANRELDAPPPTDPPVVPPTDPPPGGGTMPPTEPPPPSGPCGSDAEDSVFRLMNRGREGVSLPPIRCESQLSTMARAHAEDLCRAGTLGHLGSDGSTFGERMRGSGMPFRLAGENLARGHDDAATVYRAWSASEMHRDAMHMDWIGVGVGHAQCGDRPLWVQIFIR